jgi:uncharacterized protein (TIGR02266 family)
MTPPTGDERRRWPRIAVGLRIQMRMARPDDLFRSYHLRDVSLGGMFVKTDSPRPLGTDVEVRVEFVRGGAFVARGKVVRVVRAREVPDRSQPTGIGIEFTQMTDESRRLLEELLEDPTSTIEPPDPRTEP